MMEFSLLSKLELSPSKPGLAPRAILVTGLVEIIHALAAYQVTLFASLVLMGLSLLDSFISELWGNDFNLLFSV